MLMRLLLTLVLVLLQLLRAATVVNAAARHINQLCWLCCAHSCNACSGPRDKKAMGL